MLQHGHGGSVRHAGDDGIVAGPPAHIHGPSVRADHIGCVVGRRRCGNGRRGGDHGCAFAEELGHHIAGFAVHLDLVPDRAVRQNPDFGTVYDTPVPLAELDFGNENFAEIDFAIVPAQDDPAVRIVNIVYTDGYTRGKPDTDIDPRQEQEPEPEPEPQPEPETPETPETPKTNDDLGKYIALLTGSVAAGLGLIGWNLIRRNRR